MHVVNRFVGLVLGTCLGALSGFADAQDFPSRPITIIVPLPSGSSSDQVMRLIANKMSVSMGQPVVLDNRAGANGLVGFTAARQAKPDGYTLLLANVGPLSINPWLYDKLPYDPIKDFQPISLTWSFPSVLFVPGNSEIRTLSDLIARIRARPGSYGSQGIGSGGHLLGELLKTRTGADLVHVPYKGSVPVLADTIAGRVDLVFDGISVDKAQMVRDGRLRAIAVADTRRSVMLPGVPTTAEGGLQGFELSVWFGVVAPAGLPAPLLTRVHAELVKGLRSPDIAPRMDGFDIVGSTPEEFAARIAVDLERLGPIVKNSGARAE